MNPNEKPNGTGTPVWPGRRTALRRLLLITAVVFPLSWAVNALLVGSWNLLGDRNAESVRHLVEWQVIWIAAVAVIFLASLLPQFRGLFGRFKSRRLFFALVCFVTLVVLFYAEENWRGARTWNKYRQELEANGAQLDLAAFIPKTIPDEQNFAATPVVKSWFVEVNTKIFTNTTERFVKVWNDNFEPVFGKIPTAKEQANRNFVDLVAWGKGFDALHSGPSNTNRELEAGKLDRASRAAAVPAVLEGLKTNQTALAELRAASRRPLSRYPVVYDLDNPWGIFIPHLVNLRDASRRLQLRACAELAAGRSDDALADVKLILHLADSVKDEPFLISYLVRLACVQIAIQPVWEGLAEHAWTEAQLQELGNHFQRYDFVADMKRPLEGDRAAGVLTADLVRKKGLGLLIELIGPGSPGSMDRKFANWYSGFIPRGWYYLEQLNYCMFHQMQLEGAFDPAQKRISPARINANAQKLEQEISSGSFGRTVSGMLRHRVIVAMMLPALSKIPVKAATAQTAADQVALACALERFHLANGSFPETLDALAPKFISQLPADVFTGKPCTYRRIDDGQFLLYSVGWNEKDDGGSPGKKQFDEAEGDWVWRYPAK